MTVEIMLLVLLGCVALNAFIVAINSSGTTKTVLSYTLATIILVGAVIVLLQYINAADIRAQQVREAEVRLAKEARLAEEQILREAEVEVRLAKEALLAAENSQSADKEKEKEIMNKLLEISDQGSKIVNAILAVKLDDVYDDEREKINKRAEGYLGTASLLKLRLSEVKGMAGNTFPVSISTTGKAVERLVGGVSSFAKFFKADGEDEEAELKKKYESQLKGASQFFSEANKKIADKS